MGRQDRSEHREDEPTSPGSGAGSGAASRGLEGLLLGAVIALVFLLGQVLGMREIASPDLGFHLSTARFILENGEFPQTDPFTWSVPDHRYVDLQWGFQLAVYGAMGMAGTLGIVVLTSALTFAFGALLLLRSRRREGALPISAALLLLVFFLGNYWEPRPHLFSWVLGSLLLFVLEEHARGSSRWLPFVPLILLVWVNSHSLFVLGLVILGAYGAASLVRTKRIEKPLLVWGGAGLLACLLNPYHIHGLLFPLVQFRDIQSGSGFKSATTGIAEFTSPFRLGSFSVDGRFALLQPRLLWFVYTGLVVAGVAAGRKTLRLVEWILLGGFFYVFWKANKNFGYFVMATFPMAAGGLDRLWAGVAARSFGSGGETPDKASAGTGAKSKGKGQGKTKDKAKAAKAAKDTKPLADSPALGSGRLAPGAVGGLAVTAGVAVLALPLVWTGALFDMAWSADRRGTGFNESVLPVEACRFLEEKEIDGRIWNSWNHGGYVSWATGRKVFVYSHGEVMGQAFYDDYVATKQPGEFERALERFDPTVAVVPYKEADYWLFHLDQDRDWRMVHADDVAAVFLRSDVAPEVPPMLAPEAFDDYPYFEEADRGRIVAAAAAKPKAGLVARLRGARSYPLDAIARSSFFLQTNEPDACIGVALAAVDRTPFVVPELMLNLGFAFERRGRPDWADPCFDAFLRLDGDPAAANQIRAMRAARRR